MVLCKFEFDTPELDEDLERFIGILLLSGYHRLPRQNMYWSKQEDLGVPIVASAMSRNRFESIKRYFHLANNQALGVGDKIAKNTSFIRSCEPSSRTIRAV